MRSHESTATTMMPGVTADELRRWMDTHGYSVRGLARALDLAPNTVQRYRTGEREIPTIFEMALRELERKEDGRPS